ncbi:MAG: leucine-rich repeat domain-containing protein [Prevotella sp.]|nr:leucine-rich repeat domain-containing protein [Prevotella sp.]
MQAGAYEWTDNYGRSWTFDISGSNATNLRPTERDAINGNVVIPAKVYYNGTEYSVTNIASSAFASCTGLYNVVISEGVTEISSGAFYGCPFMGTITIPSSVQRICYDAFYCNYALTKVIISDIAAWCNINFDDNANPLCYAHHLYINENTEITDLTIPSGVTSIGDYAFHDCTGLTNVTIPSSVTSIGTEAFYGCTNLTNVNIPESVVSVEEEAFTNTPFFDNKTGLVYLGKVAYKYVGTMPENTNITIIDGTVTIAPSLFSYCSGLKSVTIPESVTSIGERAFENCEGLTSVNIPSSVTEIGNFAFIRCSGLTSVTIPESITSIGRSVFNSCSGLTSVTIPESVTSIGMYAFDGCTGLTSLTIPESVIDISEGAFFGCSGLTSLTIPGSVNSIGMSAFEECTGMTDLTILEGVTNIGEYAFYGCTGLTSASIPSTVTNINKCAFRGCTSLTSVYNYSTTPQTITAKVFSIYEDATLYVPYGTKGTYQEAPYWQDFNIVEMAPTTYELLDLLTEKTPYTNDEDKEAEQITYKREFSSKTAGHRQCWFVPFDYTITADDLERCSFYRIHMFSAEAGQDGVVQDENKVVMKIVEVTAGYTLKANKPYIIKPKAAGIYEFVVENTKLKAMDTGSLKQVSTTTNYYDFYGVYDSYSTAEAEQWFSMNTNGNLKWNAAGQTLGAYRWYIKSTFIGDDYANTTFIIDEEGEDDETTAIDQMYADPNAEIEGFYTVDGIKLYQPAKGLNIVKYTDGRTKKVYSK